MTSSQSLVWKKKTQALKKGLWKFKPFDFESIIFENDCMIMVFLVCRVENHAIWLRCGQNLTNNTADKTGHALHETLFDAQARAINLLHFDQFLANEISLLLFLYMLPFIFNNYCVANKLKESIFFLCNSSLYQPSSVLITSLFS